MKNRCFKGHDHREIGQDKTGAKIVWCRRCGVLGKEWPGHPGVFRYTKPKNREGDFNA